MGTTTRLMPGYDSHWRDKLMAAQKRLETLLCRRESLTDPERQEVIDLRQAADRAYNSRFRTTTEYRDFYLGRARALLEAEGIDMPVPDIAADATVEEIDRVLATVWQAVEVTNSESF
jgi:hypothetical protein